MGIAGDDDETVEAEELTFADEDERLPWLEADDDYDDGAVPAARMVAFVLGSLVLLALIIGGGYWLLRGGPDEAMVADGSTIEAPDGPYKQRPDDPGGATAPGTGDTSFEVAEGRSAGSRVATDNAAARPSIDTEQQGAAGSGGVGVQVGAYSTRASAEQGWQQLAGRHEALSGVNHRVLEGTVDGSPIFRLQAVASSSASARDLCASLRASGADCQVKD